MTADAHIAACIRDRVCHCGEPLDVSPDLACPMPRWWVLCPACYDGEGPHGNEATVDAAVQAWADSIDPWPDLLTCCACEATARTHCGFGDPLCDGCADGEVTT